MGEVCKQPQALGEGVQSLVRIPKDSLWKTRAVQVWPGSKEITEAELDSGQI